MTATDKLDRVDTDRDALREAAWRIAAAVPDPEIPVVTVEDLGILRAIEVDDTGAIHAKLTPTYSGCPATQLIEESVRQALTDAGFDDVQIDRELTPPWTTDWITEAGREKLRAFGIAPPVGTATTKRALFDDVRVACPRCGSTQTECVSEFGSTPCKAHYRCRACREPFDYFKCL
jgi:ring-1,2-phenylacetyl-CoA epoxidase subunit PaaD